MPATGAVLVATPAGMLAPLIPGVTTSATRNVLNGYFRITDVAVGLFGGRAPFDTATVDASNHVFVFSCGLGNAARATDFVDFTTVAGGMFAVADIDGNWRRWIILGGQNPVITASTHNTSAPQVAFSVDPSCTTSMQAESATPPDLTQLVAFELHLSKSQINACNWLISPLYLVDKSQGIRLTGAAAFADFAAYQSATNLLFFSEYLDASTLVSVAPLGIATDSIESAGCTITYLEPASPGSTIRSHIDNTFFAINQPASGTANLLGWQVKSPQKNLVLTQNTYGVGGSATFNSQIFQNFLSRTIKAGETFNSSSFLNFDQVTITGGTLRTCSFSEAASEPSLVINHATGVQFSAEDLAGDIEFNLPPGAYPTFRASLETGQTLNITQGAGTYTLTGLDNLDGGGFVLDNTGGGAVVVVIADGVDVTVADPVTAGTLVIQAPQVSLSAPGIRDPDYPISVALLRQETFIIPDITAAVNTTTNTLTLADHRLTLTAPGSFLAFVPQSGATMPTDADGALEALGLYFVQSISGDDITLSRSEGGTVIDLLTAGTGTFVVRAWTQLDYQVIAAGSTTGYSVALAEPAGTTLLLKARGHQNEDLPATATEYLIREIAWGGTSQSVPDTLNFTSAPNAIYNAITAASEYTNDGESVTGISFDLDGTVQFDFDGGATLPTQDVYAWYVHYTSTEEGIRYVGDVVQALNSANINIAPPIQFENIDVGTVLRLTGAFIRRTDGANLTFIGPTSGVIEYDFDQLAVPFTVATGSGLDSTQATQLATAATVATRVDGLIEDDEGDQFTAKALSRGSGGGGSSEADWTTTERSQIRHRLGIDGTAATPTATPNLGTVAASLGTDAISSASVSSEAVTKIQNGLSTASALTTLTNTVGAEGAGLTAIPSTLLEKYQGAVWVNTVSGVNGSTANTHGLPNNPTNSWANALTLLAALNLRAVNFSENSAATVSGSDLYINGNGATLSIPSADAAGLDIFNAFVFVSPVSGATTDFFGSGKNTFTECLVSVSTTRRIPNGTRLVRSFASGSYALQNGAEINFLDCSVNISLRSDVASLSTISFNFYRCSGLITLRPGTGELGVASVFLSGGSGRVVLASDFNWTAVTITIQGGNWEIENQSGVTPTISRSGGFLESAIINQGNSAWTTATGFLTTANLPPNFPELAITEAGLVTTSNPGGGATPTEIYDFFTFGTRPDPFKADVSGLSTFNPSTTNVTVGAYASGLSPAAALTTVASAVDAIKAKSDLLTFTGTDVRATLDGETVAVGDKTGFSLTADERAAIATATEAALLNDDDGQALIDAILQVINNNLELPPLELTAIAQAVRTELTTELARIDAAITSRLADTDYTAPNNAGITELQSRLTTLRAGYLDKLNVSGTLAHTDNADTFRVDLAPVLSAIALVPTNPLLANDSRMDAIKVKTDQLTFSGGDIVATLAGEEVTVASPSVTAIVAGVNGSLSIPSAIDIRTEIDNNSTQLTEIKTIAIASKNLSAAGL